MTASFVEMLHDEVVPAYFREAGNVGRSQARNRRMLESACARPFQSAFQEEIYPSLVDKAAALFHALIADHPFQDGNKRTAVIAADSFLAANGFCLVLLPPEMYSLAIETASYRSRGVTHDNMLSDISRRLEASSVSFTTLKGQRDLLEFHKLQVKKRRLIRAHPLNTQE